MSQISAQGETSLSKSLDPPLVLTTLVNKKSVVFSPCYAYFKMYSVLMPACDI